MDLQRIKALIDLIAQSPLAEIELIEGEDRVRLVKTPKTQSSSTDAASTRAEGEAQPPSGVPTEAPQQAPSAGAARVIHAPMFGVVHLTPAPNEPAFAQLGDSVSEGQVICTIEAMKMFNAIESEFAGTLTEILVKAGQEVESGQPLFRISQ
ncbi:acetyl-CoA carboxylase biotin carboxyl carrier protein subunit [Caballeronia choica]|uniref:Biotin carboxyl carrier protein of acetyl-CoA carboxylase n=1 Tax=Caballeronia choica TaxID=326476 RepID=A0A158KU31_9BURK|nr:acetyl-CoA carboxylase biotin carboxyl carrier protein [Caballeronia choica]SAL84594.1 acetyl-CoA carboxylase biotin carboxyl carrier protein subunit [Caballeronia choica]